MRGLFYGNPPPLRALPLLKGGCWMIKVQSSALAGTSFVERRLFEVND
ncbi:MAG: hypothetical protein ACD_2C00185G0005 [uncultured bacterium (gcode 4)]|uniref:Uncharacterized protein n=1 Tax=uncultured bacterium (gcode 4) TaxID=1234023 RepID=K2H0M8_9BACT|nr:MAG: hypothetical protein ACD_2C00185G0005 [uncultured bacterium (gcode 4)]